MKKYGAIAITICLCILSMLITCFPASAADGFETNMSDWKSACGTAWTLDENGYSNGQYEEDSVTENYKHLAVSSQKVDGTKSFTYEVTFKYTGYGAGLALNVTDRDNFWAVEANQNFEFYFPTVQNGSWNKWASDGKAISEAQAENEYHTMVFDYNAENGSAAVSYDGEVMATISYVNPNIWGGYLGLYYEDAEVTFTKAVYTEKSDGGSSEIPVNSFETNMGEWSSADGFDDLIFDFRIKLDFFTCECLAYINVEPYIGRDISIRFFASEENIIPIDTQEADAVPFALQQTDEIPKCSNMDNRYRPYIHFTTPYGWLNDPNGLVYADGVYHMFYQHNPAGTERENMHWGHAVSSDLFHWEHLGNALCPDNKGTVFSGSAIADRKNLLCLRKKETPLLLFYTAAGGTSRLSEGEPFSICLAYSTDGGRTFERYAGNPLLPNIVKNNRDPKVVWCPPLESYVMALYLEKSQYACRCPHGGFVYICRR